MTPLNFDPALENINVQAFLRTIRSGESSQNDEAYRMLFGGGMFDVPPWEHPRLPVTIGNLTSTAAGAYQILARTWDGIQAQHRFTDFSPINQDRAAVALIAGRGALSDVIAGRFQEAIAKCAKEWASLPESPYGQPTKTFAQAMETFTNYGGRISEA